jgi:hypothetical protein
VKYKLGLGIGYVGVWIFLAISNLGKTYGLEAWVLGWHTVFKIALFVTIPLVLGILAGIDIGREMR